MHASGAALEIKLNATREVYRRPATLPISSFLFDTRDNFTEPVANHTAMNHSARNDSAGNHSGAGRFPSAQGIARATVGSPARLVSRAKSLSLQKLASSARSSDPEKKP
jgi:hypothetical protein